jgi:hypothetical protein
MKKSAFVLLLASVNCVGQIPEAYQTNGQLNGRYWVSLGEQSKTQFIVGYSEGITSSQVTPYVALGLGNSKLDENGNKLLNDIQQLLFPRGTPYGDVMKGLDRLFAEPENLPLPISSALRVLVMKFRSDKADDVEAELRRLRILATKQNQQQ